MVYVCVCVYSMFVIETKVKEGIYRARVVFFNYYFDMKHS